MIRDRRNKLLQENQEIFNYWWLNFENRTHEENYQKKKEYPKGIIIFLAIILLVLGVFSGILILLQYNRKDNNNASILWLQLVERIVVVGIDLVIVFMSLFINKSHGYLVVFSSYFITSFNVMGFNYFFESTQDKVYMFSDTIRHLMVIILNSIEFYIKLVFVYMVGIHHFSILITIVIKAIYGSVFHYALMGLTDIMLIFHAKTMYDIGIFFLNYKTTLDYKQLFFNQQHIAKQKKNIDLLDNLNCGIVTIKEHNQIGKINNFLTKKFNFSYRKQSKSLTKDRDKIYLLESVEQLEQTERKRFKSSPHKSSQEFISGSFFMKKTEDEFLIETLLKDIQDVNEGLDTSLLELLRDNKIPEFLKKVYTINELTNFTVIGIKSLISAEKEIFHFEVSIRYVDKRIELIFNDVSKRRIIEETQNELTNRTLYLSKLAHEFKNPLVSLTEVSNIIQEKLTICKETSQIDYNNIFNDLDLIRRLSDYVMILVKDTEVISMAHFKKEIIPCLDKCELNQVLEFCRSIMQMRINNSGKNIKFEYNKMAGVPDFVKTDETKLKQILLNILSNSLKFTSSGGIFLTVDKEDNPDDDNLLYLKFTVIDTGSGISKESLAKIFSPFNKSVIPENKIGTGLGIIILKEMIEKLGGSMEIYSEKGTKVIVKLPFENNLPKDNKRYKTMFRRTKAEKLSNSINGQVVNTLGNTIKPSGMKISSLEQNLGRVSISSSSKNVLGNMNGNRAKININIIVNEETTTTNNFQPNSKEFKKLISEGVNRVPSSANKLKSGLRLAEKEIEPFCNIKRPPNIELGQINVNTSYDQLLHTSEKKRNNQEIPQECQTLTQEYRSSQHDSSVDEEESIFPVSILLVDDENLTRQAGTRMITQYFKNRFPTNYKDKFELVEANDGLVAMYHLVDKYKIKKNGRFNMIISDMEMNYMNGMQLATMIEDTKFFNDPKLTFFLLSAASNWNKKPFIHGYFEKPLLVSKFESMMNIMITRFRSEE